MKIFISIFLISFFLISCSTTDRNQMKNSGVFSLTNKKAFDDHPYEYCNSWDHTSWVQPNVLICSAGSRCTNLLPFYEWDKRLQKRCPVEWSAMLDGKRDSERIARERKKEFQKEQLIKEQNKLISECESYGFTRDTNEMGQCILKLKEIEILEENYQMLASEIEKEQQRQKMMFLSESLLNMGSALSNSGQSYSSGSTNTATFTKVCIKEGLGGLESLTVSSTALCPLGYDEYY